MRLILCQSVVKAIDVLLCKLNCKEDWLTKILFEALVALTNNHENSNVTSSADKKDYGGLKMITNHKQIPSFSLLSYYRH